MKVTNITKNREVLRSKKNEMSFNLKRGIFVFLFICLISILFSISTLAAVWYNVGPGLIENQTWYENFTNVSGGSLNLGDINNDGDLDLVLTGSGSSVAKVYENNGTSFDENSSWQQDLIGVYYSSTAFGDIDNDGDLDLISTGCNETNTNNCPTGDKFTRFYENNGTSFHENSTWQQNLTDVYFGAVAFGDLDNDGDLDLVLTGANSSRIVKIYLNNGTSLVESTTWQQNLTAIYESAVVLGDVDNDGDLDLVLTGDTGGAGLGRISKVYLNNGTSLVESQQWYTNLQAVDKGTLVLMDFDNDGDLDLDLTGCCDYNNLYHNNGSSFILNQSTSSGDLYSSFEGSLSFGDYDNDGDLDMAVTGREGISYIQNNNATSFAYVVSNDQANLRNIEYSTILWGDLDNDSDLDLIQTGSIAGSTFSEVYTNNITTSNTQPSPPIQFTNYTTLGGNIHLGWGNGSDSETPSNGLYYNLRIGSSSGGNQIITGKYGGGEDNGYFGNMMQRKNFTLKSSRLNPNTEYLWSVQVIDTGLRTSSWSNEQNFTTGGDLTPPTVTLNTPVNNFNNTPYQNITFNATIYDNINVTNVTLWGNWTPSGWHLNSTNSTGINTSMDYLFSVNLSMYDDGYYIWGIKACDNSSLCSLSENRTFSIDTTYPEIDLISPSNDSTSTSSTVTFSYNVTDLSISNCSLIIDSSIQETDYSILTDTPQTFTKSLANGAYNWNINCTDEVNYQNSSQINKLTISYQPSTGGPSHGGIRAYTGKPVEKEIEKPIEKKPIKKITIKEEHLKEIKIPEKPIKEKVVSFFEIIWAFIISLFIISSYIWIIKEDFPKK